MQIGTVSDDELLDLLDLALSADTSNTVKRARDLMRSRIDPMQLISQLANIIMDVLAGKCQEEDSEVKRSFLRRHACKLTNSCALFIVCPMFLGICWEVHVPSAAWRLCHPMLNESGV